MDPFPPIPADAEVHADENVCEPRERAWAIAAIVIAFLLALLIMMLALWMGLAGGGGGIGTVPGEAAGGNTAGSGIGTGTGSGIGAGDGTGSGDGGSGTGSGESGDGRMAEGPEQPAPPPGEPENVGTPEAVPAPAVATPEVEPPKFGFTPPDAPPPPPPPVVEPPKPVVQPPPGLPSGSPSSGSSGGAGGSGTGAEFMGVRTTGRTVVYLIDRSLSMEPWFAPTMRELDRSLNALDQGSRFMVAFFGGSTLEHMQAKDWRLMPPGRAVSPAPTARQKALQWARQQAPVGDEIFSDPTAAIERLISLRPDAVIMLTDGCFHQPSKVMAAVARWAKATGSPIHSILIGAETPRDRLEASDLEEARQILTDIARTTGGEFRLFTPQ